MPLIQSSPEDGVTAGLRLAFSHGPTAEAAALFLRELDAGLDWETVTQAVAIGTAERFGPSRPASPASSTSITRTRPWRGVLAGLLLYVLAEPILGLGHELSVAGFAVGLRSFVSSGLWQPWISALRLDPIYAGAAIRSVGGVRVEGLSIAGPPGTWLHAAWPDLFLSPDLVRPGAFTSMVAALGANVLGRAAASFGADVLLLLLGLLLASYAGSRVWLSVFGLLVQAEVAIGHLLSTQVGARELDASGVPFALALVIPTAGWWSTEQLAGLPQSWQAAVVGLALVIAAYAVVLFVLLVTRASLRLRRQERLGASGRGHVALRQFAAVAAVAVAVVCSPLGGIARGASNWQPIGLSTNPAMLDPHLGGSPSAIALAAGTPSMVRLAQDAQGRWQYMVDGRPEIIRGVGYNPQYAALPTTERARLYERDFRAIRSAGANTIEGWFETQFDDVTLESAAQNGLGVILPFELNHDWNYADPAVQTDILARVSQWVLNYRNASALRMWAPGNENLHRVLYPKWVSQEHVPAARARAEAFAAFLPRLVDRIHALDPNHPVLYRDAEDVYLGWLKQGFEASPDARPWFVYGANVYSETRLDEIIARWPSQWIGGPLVISEFGPAGQGPDARALGYRQDWQRLRTRPAVVLGGLAYAWATNGPEDLDRVFGLVDADGKPCDAALSALATAYLNDPDPGDGPRQMAPAPLVGMN